MTTAPPNAAAGRTRGDAGSIRPWRRHLGIIRVASFRPPVAAIGGRLISPLPLTFTYARVDVPDPDAGSPLYAVNGLVDRAQGDVPDGRPARWSAL